MLDPVGAQWSFGIDLQGGMADAESNLTHNALAFSFWGDYAFLRHLSLTARIAFATLGRTGEDAKAGGMNIFLGGLRTRLYTDEIERNAWSLEASAGVSLMGLSWRGTEGVARLALGRSFGDYFTPYTTINLGLELSYLRSLGDLHAQMLLAGVRFGFETNIREPLNINTPWPRPKIGYTSEFAILMGGGRNHPNAGVGYTAGLALGRYLDILGRADLLIQEYSAMAGLRVHLLAPEPVPAYLEVMGGYSKVYDTEAAIDQTGPLIDAELGIHFLHSCAGTLKLGARFRTGIYEDGSYLRAGFANIAWDFGHSSRYSRLRGHCGRSIATVYVPPPPRPPVPPPSAEPVEPRPQPAPATTIEGDATPEVEVVIEPVEIEVVLGASLLGGAVRIAIDPHMIPWSRLLASSAVDVELRGPRALLRSAQADLTVALQRRGVRVRTWQWRDDGNATVRAVFTIWPDR
jgi:hypothetical protein